MILFVACDRAPDPAAYRDALHSGQCERVEDPSLRDDCWLHHVDVDDPTWCDRFATEKLAAECAFVMAERRREAAWCARAGDFADDCRLHLLSQLFRGKGAADEGWVPTGIEAAGLSVDDPRGWSAWYRWRLGAERPLDLAPCATLPTPMRQESCVRSGVAMFHDRINHARDRRTWDCVGPLPELLAWAPHPLLDEAFAQRRGELCGPR